MQSINSHVLPVVTAPNLIIARIYLASLLLGRVDGFDQDKAESKRDERAVIARCLLAAQCDALEPFEFADCLLDTGPPLVKNFRKEGGNVFGVGSIRDCRAYSALTCGFAV